MLQTLNVYDKDLLFIVRTHMFESDQLLLSWIVQGCDNTYSTCFKLCEGESNENVKYFLSRNLL